jgi:hypothetical protein
MSHRTATWVAWSLWVVCAALIALAVLLDFLTADVPLLPGEGLLRLGSGLAVLTGVLSLAYPTVGALIASRLPTNPIGWIFCGVGLLYGVRRFIRGGVCGLVLDVDRARRADSGRNIPYAAVSRWSAAVSSVADRGMGGALGSCVTHTRTGIQARAFVRLLLG